MNFERSERSRESMERIARARCGIRMAQPIADEVHERQLAHIELGKYRGPRG